MSQLEKPYNLTKLGFYVANDPQQIREMIELFLQTTAAEIDMLQQAVDHGNWDEVYKLAHRIKPSIDVFDILIVMPLIREVELLARKKEQLEKIPAIMKIIAEKMTEVFEALSRELKD